MTAREKALVGFGKQPVAPDARIGDWMQTASGRQFWPLDPRPEEVHIEDIAAALSKLCRFGGHTKRFYSVAEHCVLMAHAAPPSLAFAALMHDASEAYLSDVIRPIKRHLGGYLEHEARLERVIAKRFGLEWPMPTEVKRMDRAILADERDQAMASSSADWALVLVEPPLGVTLQFWAPERAEAEFLCAFRRYYRPFTTYEDGPAEDRRDQYRNAIERLAAEGEIPVAASARGLRS